jgi:peptidoglycan/LPS O-acetylase OafA/YrhL
LADPPISDSQRVHYLALDGLRGIAILLVMALHLIVFEPATRAEDVVYKAVGAGWMGVDLFFVLSGFLITGILLDAKGDGAYFRTFYTRRALRIFPLYYGYLAVLFFICPLFYAHQPAVVQSLHDAAPWYWSYLVNVRVAIRGWSGTAWDATPFGTARFWSLAVEEQFYILWPLIVLALSRQTLVRVCAGIMVVAFGLRLALGLHHVGPMVAFVTMPTRMDALAAGAIVAALARNPGGLAQFLRPARAAALVAAAVFVVVVTLDHGFAQWLPLMQIAGFSAIAVLCGWLIAEAVTAAPHTRLARTLTVSPLRAFGRYGYGLYVLHSLAPVALAALGVSAATLPLFGNSQMPRVLLIGALSFSLSYLFAFISWHGFEKHFLKLKDRVGQRRSRPRVTTPESPDTAETRTAHRRA